MSNSIYNFKPYNDSQVKEAIQRILQNSQIENFLSNILSKPEIDKILKIIPDIATINEFQNIVTVVIDRLIEIYGVKISVRGLQKINPSKKYLFISNHRDIILDPTFIGYILHKNGFNTPSIAIGSNLLIEPWITDLVKLNKSFIVYRNLEGKELLLFLKNMSRYIRSSIIDNANSIWIAQREGRAKDGNDKTQISLLKMLQLSSKNKNLIDSFNELNIVPVSISYQYDPCDVLKANELYLKNIGKKYEKKPDHDLLSMKFGLTRLKGNIHISFSSPIIISRKNKYLNNNHFYNELAQEIDNKIYRGYKLFPSHFIAYDLFYQTSRFTHKYSPKKLLEFTSIIEQKIQDVFPQYLNNNDFKKEIYRQYANIVVNYFKAR